MGAREHPAKVASPGQSSHRRYAILLRQGSGASGPSIIRTTCPNEISLAGLSWLRLPFDQFQLIGLDRALQSRRIGFQQKDVARLQHRGMRSAEHAAAVPDDAQDPGVPAGFVLSHLQADDQ